LIIAVSDGVDLITLYLARAVVYVTVVIVTTASS